MRGAEKALLMAVRDRLRLDTEAGGAGFRDTECDIEPDVDFPATAGQLYVAVIASGYTPGPIHGRSGGVRDLVYGVNVVVVRRIGNVPRDRRSDVFVANIDSLNADVDRVIEAIDWRYEVNIAANQQIAAEAGSSQGFTEPLRLAGPVGEIQYCGADKFLAKPGKEPVGMMRTIPFHGARRITTI